MPVDTPLVSRTSALVPVPLTVVLVKPLLAVLNPPVKLLGLGIVADSLVWTTSMEDGRYKTTLFELVAVLESVPALK